MKKTTNEPPKHLSAEGRALWKHLQSEYVIDDSAGMTLLRIVCESFDRAQAARRQIDKEGATVADRFGQLRAHPACAIERDAKASQVSALRALRLAPGGEEPSE